MTYVKYNLLLMLVESCDYFLAVKVDDILIYNVYLPTDYHNDVSERLFVLASEDLSRSISSIVSGNSTCPIVRNFICNPTTICPLFSDC